MACLETEEGASTSFAAVNAPTVDRLFGREVLDATTAAAAGGDDRGVRGGVLPASEIALGVRMAHGRDGGTPPSVVRTDGRGGQSEVADTVVPAVQRGTCRLSGTVGWGRGREHPSGYHRPLPFCPRDVEGSGRGH